MAFEAILEEVTQLYDIGARLEGLSEHHPPISEALIKIAGSVRSAASLLAVVIAVKLRGFDGDNFAI
jgi:hypothetical protein